MSNVKAPAKSTQSRIAASNRARATKGRPKERVFINVLVLVSTRDKLNKLKAKRDLHSQGDVIDELVRGAK